MHTIAWKDGSVVFLDQTKLPLEETYIQTDDENVIAQAIKSLAIRGAPLIGIAAAYGFVLSLNKLDSNDARSFMSWIQQTTHLFGSTRPTAANLFWALSRMHNVAFESAGLPIGQLKTRLLKEARLIHAEDERTCRQIGLLGAELLPDATTILTHCNTGSLATGGDGTAQSIIRSAWKQKKLQRVFVDETRPLLQGSRLTAWELTRLQIPFTIITDSTAAVLLKRRMVNAIVVGADRIALNGDIANKIGTYGLAVLARHHDIPFYVAAPTNTIDFEMASGNEIPIEERNGSEITEIGASRFAPQNAEVFAPAFDVTPNELITAIITEEKVLRQPYRYAMDAIKKKALSIMVHKDGVF
jgi:methylthioribose-1-phosphate isomerase